MKINYRYRIGANRCITLNRRRLLYASVTAALSGVCDYRWGSFYGLILDGPSWIIFLREREMNYFFNGEQKFTLNDKQQVRMFHFGTHLCKRSFICNKLKFYWSNFWRLPNCIMQHSTINPILNLFKVPMHFWSLMKHNNNNKMLLLLWASNIWFQLFLIKCMWILFPHRIVREVTGRNPLIFHFGLIS